MIMKKLILILAVVFAALYSYAQTQLPELESPENPAERTEYYFNKLKDPNTGQIPDNIRELELAYVRSDQAGLIDYRKAFGLRWTVRGPWNVGGRTRALAIDLTNHNRLVAGGVSGGIWISNDAGTSWTKATIPTDIDNSVSVTALAQDPSNPDVWYFAGGEYIGNSASGGYASFRGAGLFKSTDGGNTWTRIIDAGSPAVFDRYFDYVWRIQVTSTGTVYVATYGGIYRSTDGTNFSMVLNSDPNGTYNYASYTDVVVSPNGTIYAYLSYNGAVNGIFKSTDGINWSNITPSSGFIPTFKRGVLAVAPSAPDTLYLLAYGEDSNGNETHILWMYDNNTGTWYDRSANIPMLGGQTGDFDSQGGYDLVIAVKPDNPNVVFIGGTNLFRSTDGFSTTNNTSWVGGYTPLNDSYSQYTNHHPDQHVLVFDPTNTNVLYSGHDGGISVTNDCLDNAANNNGETIDWTFLNNGYLTTQAYAVALDQTATYPNDLLAGFQDNGTWYSGTTTLTDPWISMLSGDGGFCQIADDGTTFYVSSQKGNIYGLYYNSTGSYLGWRRVSPYLSDPLFITPYVVDNSGEYMFILDGDSLWMFTNLSSLRNDLNTSTPPAGWTVLTNSVLNNDIYTALTVTGSAVKTLFVGTANGKIYKLYDVINNPAPVDITGPNMPPGYVSSIYVDPTNANHLVVAFSNYGIPSIFMTTDGGSTWTDISGNLEENPDGSGDGPSVRWVTVLKTADGDLYLAGTSTGLYSTTSIDSPVTWTQEAVNTIGNAVVDMVVARDADGTVAAGTHGLGVYTATYGEVASVEALDNLTLNVYPNPGQNIFYVNLPESGGRLMIFDLKGQLVYISNPKEAKHKIDLTPLQPGTYLMKYQTKSGETYTGKLLKQ